ncbi:MULTISPECIES: CrcB family protein [unclassified Allobranchiibius]|uniref:fluoride efflux transporter FluC n=1 Tax=unclassified Allobranchiibius TaxID=2649857 RepID=UPI001AA13349|nr:MULTISPECIES: CrcB family protein [unclassified Allobranchiibius]MBO1766722.1 CrcB family protein [Allobranchiibius sp. GilTou38]UIJ33737.1 CrcB family protein [Allobranchiibius sp. GilTou73]
MDDRHLPGRATTEPLDVDVEGEDLAPTPPGRELGTLAMISIGGVVGAVGRYRVGVQWPTSAVGFPWTTFFINVIGSTLLGALLGGIELRTAWARWRPLLGTGVIGGFTTFSTFAVDNQRLVRDGHTITALSYATATLAVCAAGTMAGDYLVHRSHRTAKGWRR